MKTSNQNYLYNSASDVIDVCSSFFSTSDIDYYDFSRYYKNGDCLILSTHPELFSYIISNDVYPTFHDLSINKSNYVILSHDLELPSVATSKIQRARYHEQIQGGENFSIYHRFYIVREYEDYWEISAIGTTKKYSKIIDFYLANLATIEQFNIFFKDKASRLIKQADRERVLLKNFIVPEGNSKKKVSSQVTQLVNEIINNKYLINGYNGSVILSRQESKCLLQMGFGSTAREISEKMKISQHTFNSYLYNIKTKLGCTSKNQVIEVFMTSDLKYIADRIAPYV